MKTQVGVLLLFLFLGHRAVAEEANRWRVGAPLLLPGPPGSFDETAVKDPSIVRYAGQWHLFYTARGQGQYTIGYAAAPALAGLQHAARRQLTQLRSQAGPYAAAPQVFYFAPRKKWYMIFQTTDSNYQPVYSTTETIGRPESWSAPRKLLEKQDKSKWIDFWMICDDRFAYLFLTREQKDLMVLTTERADFPAGFANMRKVFSPLHEAAHIYRAQGAEPKYVMLFEVAEKDIRRQGLATAAALDGPWKVVSTDFAAGGQLTQEPGTTPWTSEVSHGEFIRAGFDERLELPPGRLKLFFQGMPAAEHKGAYPSLPWRLGLMELTSARP